MDPTPSSNDDLDATLRQLEQVLAEEHRALRTLDTKTLEQCARDKAELCDRLTRMHPPATDSWRTRLARVRARLLDNQILLVHARDITRGLVQLHTGAPAGYGPAGVTRGAGTLRLSTTG